jgi:hypothetical protein
VVTDRLGMIKVPISADFSYGPTLVKDGASVLLAETSRDPNGAFGSKVYRAGENGSLGLGATISVPLKLKIMFGPWFRVSRIEGSGRVAEWRNLG